MANRPITKAELLTSASSVAGGDGSKERLLYLADQQDDLDPVAKFILVKFCQYGNPERRAWAKAPLLAAHCNVSVRTVHNKIALLKSKGLIEPTGEYHYIGNLKIPIYLIFPTMVFEERESGAERRAAKRQSANCKHENPAALQRGVCRPGMQLAAPVKEPSEPIEEASASSARDASPEFDRVFAAWTATGPGATSYAPALSEWRQFVDGWGAAALESAAIEYLRWSTETRRGDPKALQYWLRDLDFKATINRASPAAQAKSAAIFPDEEVREIASRRWGEAWVKSWLDGSGWIAASRTIVPRSGLVQTRIRQDLWRELRNAGVTIGEPQGLAIAPRQSVEVGA